MDLKEKGSTITLPFDVFAPPRGSETVDVFVPVNMLVDRMVLPRSAIGRFRISHMLCGIRVVCDVEDVTYFTSMEGEGVFKPFVAFTGQVFRVRFDNLTDEPASIEHGFVRGTQLLGDFVMHSTVRAALDRGRALEASKDTEVYARGWLAAIDTLFPGVGR